MIDFKKKGIELFLKVLTPIKGGGGGGGGGGGREGGRAEIAI